VFAFHFEFRTGAWAWFHDVWTCSAEVLEYWMISSLKVKLNCSWKFQRNWNVPLVLLERSWWAEFNGIYLVRFGFRMWEILFLSDICSWKFQKTRFWKETSVEDVVTLGANGTGHTSNTLKKNLSLLCIAWKSMSLTSFLLFMNYKNEGLFFQIVQVGNDLWSNIYFWKHFIKVESSNNVVEKCNHWLDKNLKFLVCD
jgi:hypothetical protein